MKVCDGSDAQGIVDQYNESGQTSADDLTYLDPALWVSLGDAASAESFAVAWLNLQCRMIGAVKSGVVVLGKPDKESWAPVALWPPQLEITAKLSDITELAMAERQGAVGGREPTDGVSSLEAVAWPLLVDDQLYGAVGLEVEYVSDRRLSEVMRQLQWGSAWLEALVRSRYHTPKDRLVDVLEMVAVCMEHKQFQAAATALVTELSTLLSCEWVSIGFLKAAHTRVMAFSHSADFNSKSNLIRDMGVAMDEAVDQQATIAYPPLPDMLTMANHAHAMLASEHGTGTLCTIPFGEDGQLLGALMLALPKGRAFDTKEIELCRHTGSLVGPLLEAKRRNDYWLIQKAWDSGHDLLSKLVGRHHIGLKILVMVAIGLVLFLTFGKGTYRISADATLEGTVQRVLAAPLAGFIAQANVRAGDIVKEGDVLAKLEDKDIELERLKWESQKEQRLREYSKALAEHDRAQVRILSAQVEQAEAQVALLEGQLARTRIVAPFDGIVVTGDLSQSLSAPVEVGQVLFEVAPLESYRVILKVDEREISQVSVGQSGKLRLAGFPGEILEMTVQKITPVSEAGEGRNWFRVEANLDESAKGMRPGMEGVGKITIDSRSQAWIWTHKMVHRVSQWFWSWWP